MQADHPMPWRDYVPLALVKLLLHPLLVLLVGAAAIQLGTPLQPAALTVMVLVAALPSASNVSLLAERMGPTMAASRASSWCPQRWRF
jgi:malonate transporter